MRDLSERVKKKEIVREQERYSEREREGRER